MEGHCGWPHPGARMDGHGWRAPSSHRSLPHGCIGRVLVVGLTVQMQARTVVRQGGGHVGREKPRVIGTEEEGGVVGRGAGQNGALGHSSS